MPKSEQKDGITDLKAAEDSVWRACRLLARVAVLADLVLASPHEGRVRPVDVDLLLLLAEQRRSARRRQFLVTLRLQALESPVFAAKRIQLFLAL